MRDRYATVFFVVAGLVFFATGATFLVAPELVPALRENPGRSPDAVNDARAIYGALELAIGGFLASCAVHPRHYEAGYRAAVAIGAVAALSRFVGFAVTPGTPAAHLAYGLLDLFGAGFAAYGLRRPGLPGLPG